MSNFLGKSQKIDGKTSLTNSMMSIEATDLYNLFTSCFFPKNAREYYIQQAFQIPQRK